MLGKRKIVCFIASLLCLSFLVSCGNKAQIDNTLNKVEADSPILNSSDVNISTYENTMKIMQNEKIIGGDRINLNVVKGEYESYQLILNAEKDVENINVELSNLTFGNESYKKDNIVVFLEKYIEVKENFEGTSAPVGMYPDALLPLDKAIEYKENKIKKGNSQALLVRFYIPSNQKEGRYEGKLTISVDNIKKDIPIELNVNNVVLSETNHLKSKFNIFDQYYLGELDSTQKMLDTYINFLGEYRLSPGTVVQGADVSTEDTVNKAYEIMQNEKLSSFAIGCPTKKENNLLTMNNEAVAKNIIAFVDKCIEEYNKEEQKGFNILSKLMMTASLIDEPDQTGRMHLVPGVLRNFHKAIKSVMDYIDKERNNWIGVDSGFIDEIRQSVKDFNLILSMSFNEGVDKIHKEIENNDCGQVIFCPYISDYGDEENRLKYNTKDKWAYICNNPKPPFPTYHIEDNLISSRVLGWTLSEYDIDGLFYWASDLNAKFDKGTGYQPIEDKFATADRYPGCNGDGFILYPGAKYGIYGPLPSIRLESIRDGIEEYELWRALKEAYKEKGADAKDIQRAVSSLIYNEAKVFLKNENMSVARSYLINLLDYVQSDCNLIIKDIKEANDNIEYYIQVAEGCNVEGENITKIDDTNYKFVKKINDKDNTLKFKVTKGNATINFNMDLVGFVESLNEDTILDVIKEKDGVLTKNIVENLEIDSSLNEGKSVKINIAQVKGKEQSITLKHNIISSLNGDVKNISFKIYNPSSKTIPLNVYAQYKNGTVKNIFNAKLIPGENYIEYNQCASTDWNKYGNFEALNFYFTEEKGNYDEKILYIENIKINKF